MSEAFAEYCRKPGTRIDKIMTMLEQGADVDAVAEKFRTDTQTIALYKKALKGKLSKGMPTPVVHCSQRKIKPTTRQAQNTKPMTDMERAAIRADFKAGVSKKKLIQKYRRTWVTIHACVRGLEQKPIQRSVVGREYEELIFQKYAEGWTPKQIEAELGIDRHVVKRVYERLHIGERLKLMREGEA